MIKIKTNLQQNHPTNPKSQIVSRICHKNIFFPKKTEQKVKQTNKFTFELIMHEKNEKGNFQCHVYEGGRQSKIERFQFHNNLMKE